MPIYEFECKKCGHRFEAIVASAKAAKDEKCPACGSAEVHKTISGANIGRVSSRPSIPSGSLGGCSSPSGFS